ncbi:MAG: hypothetical protein ACKPGB_30100 [Dolichospermum sp.]
MTVTVIEFFEKCENYSSSNAVWAEKATSESEILVGEIPNNSGGYLETIPPDGWVFLGTIAQIMDARSSWHQDLEEEGFDPYFVDHYLFNLHEK